MDIVLLCIKDNDKNAESWRKCQIKSKANSYSNPAIVIRKIKRHLNKGKFNLVNLYQYKWI